MTFNISLYILSKPNYAPPLYCYLCELVSRLTKWPREFYIIRLQPFTLANFIDCSNSERVFLAFNQVCNLILSFEAVKLKKNHENLRLTYATILSYLDSILLACDVRYQNPIGCK